MTEHLPECVASVVRMKYESYCICPELRACEERVTERWESLRGLGESYAYKTGSDNGFDAGLNAGLDAAREAIEGEWTQDPSWDGTNWNNSLTCALTAIDALRIRK